jgi:hypothetical protein
MNDTRTSEGDLFEISPEFGKKKWKKRKAKYKVPQSPLISRFKTVKFLNFL